MRLTELQSDDVILAEIGARIASRRIEMHLTQADLAEQAGIGKRTVERLENGGSTQMSTLIRIFRVLKLLPNLDTMIPEPGINPLDMVKLKRKSRKRASRVHKEGATTKWEWKEKV
jgi:transcriptional regulator with XRE-family HTH domain